MKLLPTNAQFPQLCRPFKGFDALFKFFKHRPSSPHSSCYHSARLEDKSETKYEFSHFQLLIKHLHTSITHFILLRMERNQKEKSWS